MRLCSFSLLLFCCTIFFTLYESVLISSVTSLNVTESTNATETVCHTAQDCTSLLKVTGECINGKCSRKHVLQFNWINILSMISTFLAIALTSGAGLGGGGLLVPLFMMILHMSSHDAIPLSKATVFGSAIASLVFNLRSQHPIYNERNLIDFEVVFMMEPMALAGTIIGVNLNAVLPDWLITFLLVALLTYMTKSTYLKGKKLRQKEKALQIQQSSDTKETNETAKDATINIQLKNQTPDSTNKHLEEIPINDNSNTPGGKSQIQEDNEQEALMSTSNHNYVSIHNSSSKDEIDEEMIEKLRREQSIISWHELGILAFAWIGLCIFSLLKGGHGNPSIAGIQCGTSGYWAVTLSAFPFFVAVTGLIGWRLFRRHSIMTLYNYPYATGEICWSYKSVTLYPLFCTLAGLFAGLLGIGGGMVVGPLFLHMGMLPQVAAATSSAMVLFTSSATTLQYAIMGMLPLDYAITYSAISVVASFTGQTCLQYVVSKHGNASFVIFLITVCIVLSNFLMGGIGFYRLAMNGFDGFRSLCG